MDTIGCDKHMKIAEKRIRTIKERVRGIVSTLPDRVTAVLLRLFVLFFISRANIMPTAADGTKTFFR